MRREEEFGPEAARGSRRRGEGVTPGELAVAASLDAALEAGGAEAVAAAIQKPAAATSSQKTQIMVQCQLLESGSGQRVSISKAGQFRWFEQTSHAGECVESRLAPVREWMSMALACCCTRPHACTC